MKSFPMYLDLEKGPVLLAGTGRLLLQRIQKLRAFGAELQIFSPDEIPETVVLHRSLEESDLEPRPVFVAVAGLSREESARIFALCREQGIPVNVADLPEYCTFYFPAVLQRGALTVAVGTDGTYPAAAALIRDRLEERIPERTEEILSWGQALRLRLRKEIQDSKIRSDLLRRVMAAALEQDRPLADEEIQNFIEN